MSNPLAVASVTQTLVNLLDPWIHQDAELTDTRITAVPPDKARDAVNASQLNIFLYQAAISPAWRNMDPPWTRQNETGVPALPLNLHYLLTAYGRDNRDDLGHRVLGRAMILLHDYPLLGAAEIQAALPDNDLWQQVERIRITPQPLTLDEMSKLWTTFQTQYRISVAYEVGVVLVDSFRRGRAPLPVLSRTPSAFASAAPPFPTVDALVLPDKRPSAFLGDTLTLEGHDLAADTVRVVFDSPRLEEPKRLPPAAGATATRVSVVLPDDPAAIAAWPPGMYTVAVEVTATEPPERPRTSAAVPLRLAPVLTGPLPLNAPIVAGSATIAVSFTPEVLPEQEVRLLVGDAELASPPRPAQTGSISFTLADAETGDYPLRLRADGVDSVFVNYAAEPPAFLADQRVVLA